MQVKRNSELDLDLFVTRSGGEPEKIGQFSRFCEAWEAMEMVSAGGWYADGYSLRLVDDRGFCHSCMLSGEWLWK